MFLATPRAILQHAVSLAARRAARLTGKEVRMRRRRFALSAALVTALAVHHTAHAATLTVGSNIGLNVLTPKNVGDSELTLGVPGSVGQLAPGLQPGFRVGVIAAGGAHEVYFEPG